MNSSIQALRAISAVTFQRILFWAGLIVGIVLLVLIGLALYLGISVSHWWFLAFILLAPVALLAAALAAAFHYLTNRLLPRKLSRQERVTIRTFADKVMGLAEVRATPWPVLAFLIGKDILRGKPSTYLKSTINDAASLHSGFNDIRRMFERKELR